MSRIKIGFGLGIIICAGAAMSDVFFGTHIIPRAPKIPTEHAQEELGVSNKESKNVISKLVIKDRKYYKVAYDESKKCPLWVSYKMSPSDGKRDADRSDDKFYPDDDIKTALPSDYTRTGYDRGHMVASADMAFSESAQKETFRMSNVCMQTPALNRGLWKNLESDIRSIAKTSVIEVVAGPIYGNTNKIINGIVVPTSYWKLYKSNGVKHGYICENGDTKENSLCSEVDASVIMKKVIDKSPIEALK